MNTTLPIPDDALDGDIAILGKKGGGKSITGKDIAERLLDLSRRVLVLDPLGHWHGLRTSADGQRPGYPIAVFGGEHGDLPLDPAMADHLARIIAAENLPAILDLSELSKHKQQEFLIEFLLTLRSKNREALTVILEEADVFAPQNPLGDDSKALHAEIDWLARRGRFKGFRLVTISQRPARLSKDVLTQANALIVHRLPAPQDRSAVEDWIQGNGDREKAKEVLNTLAGLAVGESWIWVQEPAILKRARWPMTRTLDTSATPKAGETRIEAKTLAQVDVSAIREALAGASKQVAKINTPVGAPSAAALKAAEEHGYQRGKAEGLSAGYRDGWDAYHADARLFVGNQRLDVVPPPSVEKRALLQSPKFSAESKRPPARQPSPSDTIHSGGSKMLAVLDTNPPVKRSWQQVATLAGLKARGGHFNTGRKSLVASGLIVEGGGLVWIKKPTAEAVAGGISEAGIINMWAAALDGLAPRILRALYLAGGAAHRETIAGALEVKPSGGHWNTGWKQLRDNSLVRVDDNIATLVVENL